MRFLLCTPSTLRAYFICSRTQEHPDFSAPMETRAELHVIPPTTPAQITPGHRPTRPGTPSHPQPQRPRALTVAAQPPGAHPGPAPAGPEHGEFRGAIARGPTAAPERPRLPLPAHKLAALPRHWPRPGAARRADWTTAPGPAPSHSRAGRREWRGRKGGGGAGLVKGRGQAGGRGGAAGGRASCPSLGLRLAHRKFIFKNQLMPKLAACTVIDA